MNDGGNDPIFQSYKDFAHELSRTAEWHQSNVVIDKCTGKPVDVYRHRLVFLRRTLERFDWQREQCLKQIQHLESIESVRLSQKEDRVIAIRGWLLAKYEEMERDVLSSTSRARVLRRRHSIALSSKLATVIGVTRSDRMYYIAQADWGREYIENVHHNWRNKTSPDKQWIVELMADRLEAFSDQIEVPIDQVKWAIENDQGEPWNGIDRDEDY